MYLLQKNSFTIAARGTVMAEPTSKKLGPKIGEWWMCRSVITKRMCPMIRVKDGWGSLCSNRGKPLDEYIQLEQVLEPLYKMQKV